MKFHNIGATLAFSSLIILSACGGGSDSNSAAQPNGGAQGSVPGDASGSGAGAPGANAGGTGANAGGTGANAGGDGNAGASGDGGDTGTNGDPGATGGSGGIGGGTEASAPMAPNAASRFLAQASFGPTAATINQVASGGAQAWMTAQFAKPQVLHRAYMDRIQAGMTGGSKVGQVEVFESFWQQAAGGDDQLRQRVAFALSQIFVISMMDESVNTLPRGTTAYYDMLAKNAFGNFRTLLEGVALHPAMGRYLSHLHNEKEAPTRSPDENFAREIMQLMSIGLYQLNPDGSLKLSDGKPIETYTHDDVAGLAKVFTGFSWYGSDRSATRFFGWMTPDPEHDIRPMMSYPAYHSHADKRFLGVTISGNTTAEADVKVALDTLFNHPNVGPFIGRQLIQRLVMSNPSPAYVGRVTAAFNNNGAGVRGDMKAVLRAILLDKEAREDKPHPKLREPILRLTNWMRAFNAKSASGRYQLGYTEDPLNSIGQSPLRSPSVFNYYRPAYVPPNTSIADAGMVAPEMQIVAEPSVTGYLNYMQDVIKYGAGNTRDVQPNYSTELTLVDKPGQLLDRVNLLLLNGAMSSTLRAQILGAIDSVPIPVANSSNATAVTNARNNRVYLAVFLAMASSEYLVQK
ncbi:MAG: DUF1800 domain-containing protein [Pseudomonadota bacterium]